MGIWDKVPDPEELYRNMGIAPYTIISREEWGALPPTSVEKHETLPVKNMVFGWTQTEKCHTKEECIKTMQELQKKHMAEGMPDIRYSYVVGYDQNIYEGRGWLVKAGKHPRFPDLNGDNVELVYTGFKGDAVPGTLPHNDVSSHGWSLIDQSTWDGILEKELNFFLDFENPLPPYHEKYYRPCLSAPDDPEKGGIYVPVKVD